MGHICHIIARWCLYNHGLLAQNITMNGMHHYALIDIKY